VTQILHPDDDDHFAPPSPKRMSIPTIGIDNPVFGAGEEGAEDGGGDLSPSHAELADLHTALPHPLVNFR